MERVHCGKASLEKEKKIEINFRGTTVYQEDFIVHAVKYKMKEPLINNRIN